MQTSSPSKVKKIATPPHPISAGTFSAAEASTGRTSTSKTMEEHCKTCGRNTVWEEIRSWSNPYGLSDLHPTDIRVGWTCRTCGTRKSL